MGIYKLLLIILGLIILVNVVIYAVIEVISDIDYKRQISGKRPMREYKGHEPLEENFYDILSEAWDKMVEEDKKKVLAFQKNPDDASWMNL